MNKFEPAQEDILKPEAHEAHEAPKNVEKSASEIAEKMGVEANEQVDAFQFTGEKEFAPLGERAKKEGLKISEVDTGELRSLDQNAVAAQNDLAIAVFSPPLPKMPPPLPEEYVKQFSRTTPPPLPTMPPPIPQEHVRTTPPPLPVMPPPLPQEARMSPPPLPNDYVEKFSQATPPPIPHEHVRATPPPFPSNLEIGARKTATQARNIENPELLDSREASKKILADERSEIAREFWQQRRMQKERLSKLSGVINAAQEKIQGEKGDFQYGRIADLVAAESNLIVNRITAEEILDDMLGDEREVIDEAIDNSEAIKMLKQKIEEHYLKADAKAKEKFDTLSRSVENVMRRNNAFIVHIIAEDESNRHNLNSNVSSSVTYEDDIDIMLSLEPSVSASSFNVGEKTNLWAGQSGFLFGGGQIGEAGSTDIGTRVGGIKDRGGEKSSIEEIDKIVGRSDKDSRSDYKRLGMHGMNEIVVNNPEVFGFFQFAGVDEDGKFWINDIRTKQRSEDAKTDSDYRKELREQLQDYRNKFNVASERGIPLYVTTDNMEVFECFGVNDDGTIEVGKKITPEEVATGRAGLATKKRKDIGERILQKRLFKKEKTMQEAREIINNL